MELPEPRDVLELPEKTAKMEEMAIPDPAVEMETRDVKGIPEEMVKKEDPDPRVKMVAPVPMVVLDLLDVQEELVPPVN